MSASLVGSVVFGLINSDDDNKHITTDEINIFLEDTGTSYDDLADMSMDEALVLLQQAGEKKFTTILEEHGYAMDDFLEMNYFDMLGTLLDVF